MSEVNQKWQPTPRQADGYSTARLEIYVVGTFFSASSPGDYTTSMYSYLIKSTVTCKYARE